MIYFDKTKIKNALNLEVEDKEDVTVMGWVKTKRGSKNIAFLELNDGSTVENLQVVILNPTDFEELEDINTDTSVRINGYLEAVEGREQSVEMKAEELSIIGDCPADYPLQKKEHSNEFLREIAHLRPRTTTFGVINRFRSKMSYAVHQFFQERDFSYVHTPIITANDTEGAGELFTVTNFDLADVPVTEAGQVDFEQDFFAEETGLTVSGQLEAEVLACGLGDVYTFGPTFRAENSNTRRHAAEFWMIEPEMAFCDLEDNMQIIEEFLQYLFQYALEECKEELEFFNQHVAEEDKIAKLEELVEVEFARITYTEAIEILEAADKDFEFEVEWGIDLQTEHERYLAEDHFAKPVMVTDYPLDIKAFYMRLNEDGKTVRAVDCLVPGVGEIVGGSQREERYDVLVDLIDKFGLEQEQYQWFLDLRKYGTVPHSGFGLGFERILMYMSGVSNIRDIISFPRTPGNAEF